MRKYLFALAVCIIALASCDVKEATSNAGSTAPANAISGAMIVKTKAEMTQTQVGDYKFKPLYKVGGRFEKRQREAGLHLWYLVTFDPSTALTKASSDLASLSDIESVEYVPEIAFDGFNDPIYNAKENEQWHYNNLGVRDNSVAGCDINLEKAWEYTTGSPNVIVAVSDGSIDFNHPDLKQNMWRNEAELNGIEGVDDDGNGFVDDYYGTVFSCDQAGNIQPYYDIDDHGTHIGGTIAAVNNNGIGLCGIAGGNGDPSTGVRLMIAQTSSNDSNYRSAYIGQAFVYAADNGAVLINCSWHIPDVSSTPASIRTGIEYFNAYAGLDEHGKQVGPMAGGLCIFAAGNDSKSENYPSMDDDVLAVGAIGADWTAAYYTNYGSWVDVAAPGGDYKKGNMIVSTLPDGQYGYMQGTSMACPHAVGVAALIVSKYQGEGFTRANLIDLIKGTANTELLEHEPLPIGVGLIDAGNAVSMGSQEPVKVKDVKATAKANIINVSFEKQANESGNYPSKYNIFTSTSDLSSLDPENPGSNVKVTTLSAKEYTKTVAKDIEVEKFNTTYYIRVDSETMTGVKSELSDQVTVTTGSNTKPDITPTSSTNIRLKGSEVGKITFSVTDKDEHTITCRLAKNDDAASISFKDNVATVTIQAVKSAEGTFTNEVVASDGYSESRASFSYTVLPNRAPTFIKLIGNQLIEKQKGTITLNLDEYIKDEDGDELRYTCESSNNYISGSISGSTLTITGNSFGTAEFKLTAVDPRGSSYSEIFTVVVRDGKKEIDIYPNPVINDLYIRTAKDQTINYSIVNNAGAEFKSASSVQSGPFSAVKVDMKDAAPGQYFVVIKDSNGTSKSYPIVKR